MLAYIVINGRYEKNGVSVGEALSNILNSCGIDTDLYSLEDCGADDLKSVLKSSLERNAPLHLTTVIEHSGAFVVNHGLPGGYCCSLPQSHGPILPGRVPCFETFGRSPAEVARLVFDDLPIEAYSVRAA